MLNLKGLRNAVMSRELNPVKSLLFVNLCEESLQHFDISWNYLIKMNKFRFQEFFFFFP